MDIDDDDDIYAPSEPTVAEAKTNAAPTASKTSRSDDLEEGEEEDEEVDMDEDDSVRACPRFLGEVNALTACAGR